MRMLLLLIILGFVGVQLSLGVCHKVDKYDIKEGIDNGMQKYEEQLEYGGSQSHFKMGTRKLTTLLPEDPCMSRRDCPWFLKTPRWIFNGTSCNFYFGCQFDGFENENDCQNFCIL